MRTSMRRGISAVFALAFFLAVLSLAVPGLLAQSAGSSGSIYGTVTDPTGAIIPGAAVSIQNPVSGYSRQNKTDGAGHYQFNNLPLNPYHLTISATGFGSVAEDVDVRSTVPVTVNASLKLGTTATEVNSERT